MDGFFINSTNSSSLTCTSCSVGTKTCKSNTTSLTCMPGYGLTASKCNKCGSGVESCDNSVVKCYAGFVLSGTTCSCPAG